MEPKLLTEPGEVCSGCGPCGRSHGSLGLFPWETHFDHSGVAETPAVPPADVTVSTGTSKHVFQFPQEIAVFSTSGIQLQCVQVVA